MTSVGPGQDGSDVGLCGFDDATGRRCAEALGLDAGQELGDGFDGRTYALDRPAGHVLKVTRRPQEAALAGLIAREAAAGRSIEGMPTVLAAARLEAEGVQGPLWGIVREALHSAAGGCTDPSEATTAAAVLRGLSALRDRHGLAAAGLGVGMLGATAAGTWVLRDLGQVSGTPDVIGALLDALPPAVPVPAEPVPAPRP